MQILKELKYFALLHCLKLFPQGEIFNVDEEVLLSIFFSEDYGSWVQSQMVDIFFLAMHHELGDLPDHRLDGIGSDGSFALYQVIEGLCFLLCLVYDHGMLGESVYFDGEEVVRAK